MEYRTHIVANKQIERKKNAWFDFENGETNKIFAKYW